MKMLGYKINQDTFLKCRITMQMLSAFFNFMKV